MSGEDNEIIEYEDLIDGQKNDIKLNIKSALDDMNININEKKEENNLNLEIIDNETPQEFKKRLNKKISEFSKEEKAYYNTLSQRTKRDKDKKIEVKKEEENIIINNNAQQNTLYNQLFVLKQKFPDNTKEIHIDKDMSIHVLQEKKDLILQIITQKNSHNVIFETLLLLVRTGERSLNYFEVEALDGYAENVDKSKEDIIPILKEMIDLGEIDISALTPQLRLMIVMSSVAVKTIEENNDKKKNAILSQELGHGGDGVGGNKISLSS